MGPKNSSETDLLLARLNNGDRAALDLERRVVDALSADGRASISDLARTLERPARSVLRHVSNLVRQGRVRRTGRARATRYELS